METLRRWISAPYRVLSAVVNALGRFVTAAIACLVMTVGLVLWITFGYLWIGLAVLLVGLVLAGRAIA